MIGTISNGKSYNFVIMNFLWKVFSTEQRIMIVCILEKRVTATAESKDEMEKKDIVEKERIRNNKYTVEENTFFFYFFEI